MKADIKKKTINAKTKDVFDAIKNPKKLAVWWGPNGFTNTFNEFNFNNGGYWNYIMHSADGANYKNESRFLEIQENKKVVIEHISEPHFVLTITLNESDNKTIVKWEQEFETEEQYQKLVKFVSDANQQNLDRLASLIESSI